MVISDVKEKFGQSRSLRFYLIFSAVLVVVVGLIYTILFVSNPTANVEGEFRDDGVLELDATVVNKGSAGNVSLVVFTLDEEGYILNRTERKYEMMSNQRKDGEIILNISDNYQRFRYCTYPSKNVYRTFEPFLCDAYQ